MTECVACGGRAWLWTPDGSMCSDACADLKLVVARALGCSPADAASLMRDAQRVEDPLTYIREMLLCETR